MLASRAVAGAPAKTRRAISRSSGERRLFRDGDDSGLVLAPVAGVW
jgi:hypothetical protein